MRLQNEYFCRIQPNRVLFNSVVRLTLFCSCSAVSSTDWTSMQAVLVMIRSDGERRSFSIAVT